MPTDADQPAIRIPSPWQVRPGCLHGIRQSTLTGSFRVRIEPEYSFDALDEVIAATLQDTPYVPPAAECAVTALASRVLYWMIALQLRYSIPVSELFKVGVPAPAKDGWSEVDVAVASYAREATQACFSWVLEAVNTALSSAHGGSTPAPANVRSLEEAFKPYSVGGTNMFHFLRAALDLDIPFSMMVARIFSFGTGHRTRWLYSTITDQTPQLGVRIAHNKIMTAELMRRGGLPAPSHIPVGDAQAAVRAAEKLGYPVVVKPTDQEQGRGVAANLRTADAVRAAVAEALPMSKNLLVEKHFHGKDYRLTVARGEVIKIENRIAGGVEGDGVSTIEMLVRQLQDTPRFRKTLRDSGKVQLGLDAEAMGLLEEAGLTTTSVPAAGEDVVLRRKNNVSTGGLQVFVAVGDAHPDNLALAIRAAALLRLDFAGIDLLIPDIKESWLDTGALICEVNAQPQIGVRTTPDIYRDILADLIEGDGRIPVHLVVTTSGTTIDHDDAVRRARELGCGGLATASGVWIDGKRLAARPDGAYHAATILLADLAARSALCIVTAAEVVEKGLPASRFQSIRIVGQDETADVHRREATALIPLIEPHAERLLS